MTTIRKYISMAAWQKIFCLFLSFLMLVSVCMAGSYAFRSLLNKENLFIGAKTAGYSAVLFKYERDLEGAETQNPIKNTVFFLYKRTGDEKVQIGGRYLTDKNGKIEVHNLTAGNYVFTEAEPTYGYTYDKDKNGKNITDYPFTLDKDTTDGIAKITAYNPYAYGALEITKTVQNADSAPLTQEQKDTPFAFTLKLSHSGSYRYSIAGAEQENSIQSGDTLYLKHGQTAKIWGLPVGTLYTVTETPTLGYVMDSNNHQGNITESGAKAEFINTYTNEKYGQLNISKTVIGKGFDIDQPFTFTIEFSDGKQYPYTIGNTKHTLNAEGKFTLKHGETAAFSQLPVGITYTVQEDETEGYTASIDKYLGEIAGGTDITLPFVNHYASGEETGSLILSKTILGEEPDVDQPFTFIVTFDGKKDTLYTYEVNGATYILGEDGKVTLKHGETAVFSLLPVGLAYTVTEEETTAYTAIVKEINGTIPAAEATCSFYNLYTPLEKATLTVKKITTGQGADPNKAFTFTVFIRQEGSDKGEETKFTLKHGEQRDFNLNIGDYYAVYEDDFTHEGYVQSTIANGSGVVTQKTIEVVKTNTYIGGEMVKISGEKTWDMSADPNAVKPKSITVHLMNGDTIITVAEVTPNEKGQWYYTFTAPKYDALGKEIVYTVQEVPVPGYTSEITGYDIKNTPISSTAYAPIVKKIINGAPLDAADFTFTITPLDSTASSEEIPMPIKNTLTIQGAGEKAFEKITFSQAGTYRYTITETKGTHKGYTYDTTVYTLTVSVVEEDGALVVKSAQYTKSGDKTTFKKAVFTNQYNPIEPNTDTVKVTKVWAGGGEHPDSVQVQLYQDGAKYGQAVTLTAENNWTHTWTKLEQDHTWTVDEPTVPDGYKKSIKGNAETDFVITNTKNDVTKPVPDTVTISGSKTWIHGSNAEKLRPSSITVFVMDGSYVVRQRVVTSANAWQWSFTLPKYDDSGKEIAYTIDESAVNNYSKRVDGYNLINTYTPDSGDNGNQNNSGNNGGSGTSEVPKTDDPNNMVPWFVMIILSAFSLRWLLFRIGPIKKKS